MGEWIWLVVGLIVVLFALTAVIASRSRQSDVTQADPAPSKPRGLLAKGLGRLWRDGLDDTTWERLEEVLLSADVGVKPTADIVSRVRSAGPADVDEARRLLASALEAQFLETGRDLSIGAVPSVILVVGVNGSGKTTTIAKLAHRLTVDGKHVVLAAADTFRAAAGEQLETWATRVGVDLIKGQQGGDPASVAFDAVASAKSKGADVVIVDTAGRLHGKKNLMSELQKIYRVVSGEAEVSEVLLVLDATSGQNGLAQVEQFGDAVPLTGIALAKLDGTARGGIVVAVERRLGVPVKFVGLGETVDDLHPFDPGSFVEDLLEE